MRIALFISALHTGGAQRQVTNLAAGLTKLGIDTRLICIYPGGKFWHVASGNPDVNVVALFEHRPRFRLMRALGLLWAPFRLRKVIHRARVGVLYSMLDLSNLIAGLASRGRKGPPVLIWGIRSTIYLADYRAVIPHRLCRRFSSGVPAVISNSHSGLREYRAAGFCIDQGYVVHNGIDTDRFEFDHSAARELREKWGIGDGRLIIGIIGRIHPRKGHEAFIRMAALLAEGRPDLKFVVVGPGNSDDLERLGQMTREAGIENLLQFIGETDDMRAVYCAIDVVVSASVGEGFPNVIGEAMACGTPCVATDVGDSALVIGDCGVVVPDQEPASLAEGVINALERRDELGRQSRDRILQEFSVEEMVSKTLQVVETVVTRSSKTRRGPGL